METNGMTQRKAKIFNIQRYSIYDGPGIRTLVFFKGCPLRCQWCSNPEGLVRGYQVMYLRDMCIHCGKCVSVCPSAIHQLVGNPPQHEVNRSLQCIGCRACEDICPSNALEIAGKEMTVSEVMEVVESDRMFYDTSGGGMTLGGGEVMAQPDFAANLLMEAKRRGIHTAIETSGYAKLDDLLNVAQFVDLFLYDIKQIDSEKHYENTGVRNERILENLVELINRRHHVQVRMPLIQGRNADDQTLRKTIEFLMPYKDKRNFVGIDLLPYHKLGVNKYDQLDMEYPIKEDVALTDEQLDHIEELIKDYDFNVKVVRH